MLGSIKLKFTENPALELPAQGVTIFVGPNNSGKSLLLRELERLYFEHPFPPGLKIVEDYGGAWPTDNQITAAFAKGADLNKPHLPSAGNGFIGSVSPTRGRQVYELTIEAVRHMSANQIEKQWITTQFWRPGVLRLDGRSRFDLTNDQPSGDLLGPPQNILAYLFQDDEARRRVRKVIKEAFGQNFVLDPTSGGNLRIRFSSEELISDEQSLNAHARGYFARATHVKEASDGMQAFTGIVSAVYSGEFHTVLIDEPEAFLHPPLARKLGNDLATLASERKGSLFASTHSSDFLMGCVQASSEVRVVRLEYSSGKSRARLVSSEKLKEVFRNPLIRSANAVSGLFHDGVVVCESDNDRAFYFEIYSRLLAKSPDALPSILFINAQNKQTVKTILAPLRDFGVPVAAAIDIDIIKDGGRVWSDWLTAARLPPALHQTLGVERAAVLSLFELSGKDMKRDGGTEFSVQATKRLPIIFLTNWSDMAFLLSGEGNWRNGFPAWGSSARKRIGLWRYWKNSELIRAQIRTFSRRRKTFGPSYAP